MNDPGIYRKVYVRMWRYGSSFQRLSRLKPSGQALWLYLLTSEHSIIIPGVVVAGPLSIAETLGWSVESVMQLLGELAASEMIEYDTAARVIVLKKSASYQKPQNPNVLYAWGKAFCAIPECELKNKIYSMVYQTLSSVSDSKMESYTKAFGESFPQPFPQPLPPSLPIATRGKVV